MQLPVISGIRVEDFPSQKDWMPKLLGPLNQFLLSATNAINGNLTLTDNIPCQTITLIFTANGSDFPKNISWSINQNNNNASLTPPVELRVCSATENGSAIAVVPAWSYANGTITISYITKLTRSAASALTVGAVYKIILRGQP